MPRSTNRRLRSTMDSVVIHDLRNVGQRLGLLLGNLEEHWEDPDFRRNVVDLLGSTVETIDAIVKRFAAHEEAVLIKVPLDLNDLLRQVTRKVRGRNGAAGRVVTELGAIPPVWGDTYYLADAFSSVFANALEAAGPAGTVTVRTGVERARRRCRAIVEVQDDGAGMAPEFIAERLFRPFQTTKPDGVGLGLYTARQIVGFHKGEIQVESRPGEGTIVRISLPGAEATA